MIIKALESFIRDQYRTDQVIPLHAPVFSGLESDYVGDCIASTFVSSVGSYVDRFEADLARYTGSPNAIATVNGTAALHVALKLAGVGDGDLVITQPLTFVATCNAISYCNADPIFIDVDRTTLGLSPVALEAWLSEFAEIRDDFCILKGSNRVIRACVPMHTFGHPVDIEKLMEVCLRWKLTVVEDAAESLGSFFEGRHTGTFGAFGAISFNGNKIITTGGGGMILCDAAFASLAKHLTTTAKQPHQFEYIHDQIGYNYRLPNINAALGCAQLERINKILKSKRELASGYEVLFSSSSLTFVKEPKGCRSNYWLNAVICEDRLQRDELLLATNTSGIMTRPIWRLMNQLPMYSKCISGGLPNAEWLEARVVNLPSSVVPEVV